MQDFDTIEMAMPYIVIRLTQMQWLYNLLLSDLHKCNGYTISCCQTYTNAMAIQSFVVRLIQMQWLYILLLSDKTNAMVISLVVRRTQMKELCHILLSDLHK